LEIVGHPQSAPRLVCAEAELRPSAVIAMAIAIFETVFFIFFLIIG
jgi:hypothetical protein